MSHEHQFWKDALWQRNLLDASKPALSTFISRQTVLGSDLGLGGLWRFRGQDIGCLLYMFLHTILVLILPRSKSIINSAA